MTQFDPEDFEENEETFEVDDLSWDAYVLSSAGWGTDEDYGCYGDSDY
jgi:hypothetical protein